MERFEDFYDDINMDDWAEYGDVEGEHEEFEIKDASAADWAISKIADERKRKDYFVECANKEIEKLKAQIKEMEEKCERTTSYLSGCLGKYLERDEVPKKKTATQESITLPAGKIIKKLPKTEYIRKHCVRLSKDWWISLSGFDRKVAITEEQYLQIGMVLNKDRFRPKSIPLHELKRLRQ